MLLLGVILGMLVGFSLGLTGGGGAIFAVPLLVYVMAVDPREAVGVSLLTVAVTALVGLVHRARVGLVEFGTGILFAAAGMLTAPLGAWLSRRIPEPLLLVLFGGLMLATAVLMWLKAGQETAAVCVPIANHAGPVCRRDPQGALNLSSRCAMLLAAIGLVTGVLTGLFGVGGGFLIVPALVTFSGLGLQRAIGMSLLVITLVSASRESPVTSGQGAACLGRLPCCSCWAASPVCGSERRSAGDWLVPDCNKHLRRRL